MKEISSFWVCGLSNFTDYDSMEFSWQMAAFWDKYEVEHIEERLYNDINPMKHGEIGISFMEWFLNKDYEYDSSRMDFELYDERCHYLQDSIMEIFISIR